MTSNREVKVKLTNSSAKNKTPQVDNDIDDEDEVDAEFAEMMSQFKAMANIGKTAAKASNLTSATLRSGGPK